MNKVDVILGLQWGDEGKGKVVDVLTPRYQAVARFQGGPNAGHTLEFNGEKYVLRSIPSGIFQGGKTNIIGNGVVLDPILFREEATALAKKGDFEGAHKAYECLEEAVTALFAEGNPTGVKCAMSVLGLIGNTLRLPLVPGTPQLEARFKELIAKYDLN